MQSMNLHHPDLGALTVEFNPLWWQTDKNLPVEDCIEITSIKNSRGEELPYCLLDSFNDDIYGLMEHQEPLEDVPAVEMDTERQALILAGYPCGVSLPSRSLGSG